MRMGNRKDARYLVPGTGYRVLGTAYLSFLAALYPVPNTLYPTSFRANTLFPVPPCLRGVKPAPHVR